MLGINPYATPPNKHLFNRNLTELIVAESLAFDRARQRPRDIELRSRLMMKAHPVERHQPSEGSIIFSLVDGSVWASWPGASASVKLGRHETVRCLMSDYLSESELGERLAERKGASKPKNGRAT
jgi:hypothetical protein